MSASPSGLSSGQTPTPKGGPPMFVRKSKPADPLRPRKKPVRRPNLPTGSSDPKSNGTAPAVRPFGLQRSNGVAPARGPAPTNGVNGQRQWTTSPPSDAAVKYFPLITTKRALQEGLRFHIAKFGGSRVIDPSDESQFMRPVILRRKDSRPDKVETPAGEKEEQEKEKSELARAEKEAQRASDLAQIAPTASNASGAAKKGYGKKPLKTEQYHRMDTSVEDKKKSDLRYEEALSWHLEDADARNSWFGTYEAALSHVNVALLVDDESFKMIPIDKWYKFTPKAPFKTLTSEEAEASFSKKAKETRWTMKTQKKEESARELDDVRSMVAGRGLYKVKGEAQTFKASGKHETEDADELDFEADDLFQDDDEQAFLEAEDDEAKEAKVRIKRDQLAANFFDRVDEAEVEKEAEEEKEAAKKIKILGKEVKKALKKREKNLIYDSDKESDDEYGSPSSDDDTSDEEKQAEIDKRKDEEAKVKAKLEAKQPSGESTKGSNTPSGRLKHADPLKKNKSLKRPGSPNLSESSGNESSRKKHKKKHATDNPSALSNPSPANIAMSEGEATGGDMSDGSKKMIKRKIRIGGTPSGSRAGSPAPGRADSVGAKGSRATSPAAQSPLGASGGRSPPGPGTGPIQGHEIAAALPQDGITIGNLMKLFAGRVGDGEQQTEKSLFIRMVKANSAYTPDRLLRPKK